MSVVCPQCKEPIKSGAKVCPHCRSPIDPSVHMYNALGGCVGVIIVIALVIWGVRWLFQ